MDTVRKIQYEVLVGDQAVEVPALIRLAGKPLVFLIHGLGCSKETFLPIFNFAPLNEFSLLAVDLAGFGETRAPQYFAYSLDEQADICEQILRLCASNLDVHIVAHSMGGAITLLLPQARLSTLGSFANVEGNLVAGNEHVSRTILSVPFDEFHSDFYTSVEDRFRNFGDGYAAVESTTAEALYRSAESLVSWVASGTLIKQFLHLPCSAAYFYGDRNREHPVFDAISKVRKIEIPNSGHFPMNDNTSDFCNAWIKFYESLPK